MEVRDVMCIFQMFCYLSFRSENKRILILWIGLLVKYTKPKWLHTQYTSILFSYCVLSYRMSCTLSQWRSHSSFIRLAIGNRGLRTMAERTETSMWWRVTYTRRPKWRQMSQFVFVRRAIGLMMHIWIQMNEIAKFTWKNLIFNPIESEYLFQTDLIALSTVCNQS